ncbi:sugar phosphate isomerase/epimerase family protein [Cohnella sp. GCM10027633]|uniref:sugar phosphate isomerase/epimerase family protein n=1 Tax=unclassified Cohnella TaxID=2636738 RepID=UPI00362A2D2E
MKPKLSIGSWAFAFGPFAHAPWSFENVLRYARDAGYDGVEINGFPPHPAPEQFDTAARRSELRRLIESYGLKVSGYAPSFNDVPPALVSSDRYAERLKQMIGFASDIGTRTIRIDTVSPPMALTGEAYARTFEHLTDVWRAASETARTEGATIVWEFEPGFWLNKPSEVLAMCQAVDSPHFKVLFDTSHAYMGAVVGARHQGSAEVLDGGVEAYAELLAPYIGHFHLIDSDGTLHDDETSTHAAFGKGFVDFDGLLEQSGALLADLDWWCVDFCFNAEVEAWGREAVPFVRRLIEAQGGMRAK